MSRHTDRIERSAERHDGEHQVWSRADYQAGRDEGGADMLAAFQQALTAVGIRFTLVPYVELRGDRVVLLFKVVLAIPLPAAPNPPILAR
jgi:hypothetical protein